MYRHIDNGIPSPSMQTEPEDLSPHPSSSSSRSSSVGPGTATWQLCPNRLLLFCDIVLKHVNYPNAFLEPCDDDDDDDDEHVSSGESKNNILKNERTSESPLNSVGESARDSTRSSTSSTDSVLAELEPEDVDKATLESVTCWCGKPFAGRPMIECDKCLVWYHMSCEQIRRNNIPHHFLCSRCKEEKRRRKKRPSPKDERKGGKKKRSSAPAASTVNPPSIDSPRGNAAASSKVQTEPSSIVPSASTSSNSFHHEPSNLSCITNGLKVPTSPGNLSPRLPTQVPPSPPPPAHSNNNGTEKKERRKSKGSSSRPRNKKAASLGSGEKRRRSSGGGGGGGSSSSTAAAAAAAATVTVTSGSSVLNPLGLSVGASSGGLAHVPNCQPLLPYNPPSGLVNSNATKMSPPHNEQVYGDIDASSRMFSSSVPERMPVLTPSPSVVGSGGAMPQRPTPASPNLVDHQKLQSQGPTTNGVSGVAPSSHLRPTTAIYFPTPPRRHSSQQQ